MTVRKSAIDMYHELKSSLPRSTDSDRKTWASIIVENEIAIRDISPLLHCKKEVASRFLWLLSDVGEIKPDRLFSDLPYLLDVADKLEHVRVEASFAKYWWMCGIPPENESKAIDLLFGWLRSPNINVNTKSRSLFALFNMTKKYPELKNELQLCIEEQMDRNTKDFSKRAKKVLMKLNK